MTWDVLTIMGTIAFAISGAIVAMEEEYDILGVFILGLVTAFGGGVVRNLLIGIPVSTLWEQGLLLKTALLASLIVFFLPIKLIQRLNKWVTFFDAIGLAAFAIQGALYATQMNHSISAVIVAAILTGSGGGIVRDVLAGRKPLVLRDEIYAFWAMLIGLVIGIGKVTEADTMLLYTLFGAGVLFRMLSVFYQWRLPRRSLHSVQKDVS
ncbi:trimeric intracellular cation channel family protein [Brevibacillus migulae]|uniref:trimeric intracellular cation channel family protein n=1 Tax=Brevibacillus migulae TaxID=1644114 RepID=UPI00106E21B4|nr:trimeric intracellular cation channel family protein [Brevibacillus migulae]